MLIDINILAWLVWVFPFLGAGVSILLSRIGGPIRDYAVVIFSLLGAIMAALMLPELGAAEAYESMAFWISLPDGGYVGVGMLVDPLSIILANTVAFLGFIIMLYSVKYMEHEPGKNRYWFFMSLFIASMLLLVMADNLILLFIGWKMVGVCSYALIGHYYTDEEEYWVGGPSPLPFRKPSRAGLKALLVTTFGDVALLAGVIMLYIYSGTFSFTTLLSTAEVWLPNVAADPGALTIISVLMLVGPIAKSGQFPLHEWLPEAMAGPTPVSALIHAATMVKAGVYFIARMTPIFFYATWIANQPEAMTFFTVTAFIGAFTVFLTGSQAMATDELKKALAFSTMSQIGYMMLGLGLAGMTSHTLVAGVSAGIFHLISHGIFKAALFLCAGILIHATGTIYMSKMNLSREGMKYTWLFMAIASLSLMGIPPFSGFWSKEEVLHLTIESGNIILFLLALIPVAFTAFYTVRFMGIVFHSKGKEEHAGHESSPVVLATYGSLAILTVIVGIAGPWFGEFIHTVFEHYYEVSLGLAAHAGELGAYTPAAQMMIPISVLLPIISLGVIALGAIPAYRIYVSHNPSPEGILEKHGILKKIHSFLLNRWYINAFFNRVFVDGTLNYRHLVSKYIEKPLDTAINEGIPKVVSGISSRLRKIQTGILSINLLYFLIFLLLAIITLMFWVVP
jgi:NADH-quinone oxidoreductase subunit L